jgi:hypothetical protein
MDRAAVRLNNYAASLIVGLGGKYIKYPEISWDNQSGTTFRGRTSSEKQINTAWLSQT